VVHHSAQAVSNVLGTLPNYLRPVLERGYLGVDFFFVLSGFIIYYTNHGRTPDKDWARNFGESRLVRIFVPYLPVGLVLAAAYTLFPDVSASDRHWSWLASTTLLPTPTPTALSVAWTLRHELVFYSIFLISYRLGRPLLLCGLWAAACIMWNIARLSMGLLPYGIPSVGTAFLLGLCNVEFFAGVLAADCVITGRLNGKWPFVIGGLLAMAMFAILSANRNYSLFFGIALAFWVIPLVRSKLAGKLAIPSFAVFLGGASYAIYLVHEPFVSLLIRTVQRFAVLAHWPIVLVTIIAIASLVGILYHLVWERPVLAAIKHRRLRSRLARRDLIGGAGPQIH
jgi:exopolysaccharide production protein ExoZ